MILKEQGDNQISPKEILKKISGRLWRNFNQMDLEFAPSLDLIPDGLHKFIMVSGEKFPLDGPGNVVGFRSEDIIERLDHNNLEDDALMFLSCSSNFKNVVLLTENVEQAKEWMKREENSPRHTLLVAHKVKI